MALAELFALLSGPSYFFQWVLFSEIMTEDNNKLSIRFKLRHPANEQKINFTGVD